MLTADKSREAYEAGRAQLADGDAKAAIRYLERSVRQYPHFKALELLGEAWLRLQKPERAVVPLAAATALNRQVRPASLLAEALLAMGDELLAYDAASEALKRDPNNRRAQAVKEATRDAHDKWSPL